MRRLLAAVLIVMLLAVPLTAMGHSVHSHNCNSAHGYVLDGGGWRHSAVRSSMTGPPAQHTAFITHQQWISGDGLNKYVTQHYNYVAAYCPGL